jgi:hypothetical protein
MVLKLGVILINSEERQFLKRDRDDTGCSHLAEKRASLRMSRP